MLKGLASGLLASQVGGGAREVCAEASEPVPLSRPCSFLISEGEMWAAASSCACLPLPACVLPSGSRSSASAALLTPRGSGRRGLLSQVQAPVPFRASLLTQSPTALGARPELLGAAGSAGSRDCL